MQIFVKVRRAALATLLLCVCIEMTNGLTFACPFLPPSQFPLGTDPHGCVDCRRYEAVACLRVGCCHPVTLT